MGLDHRLLQAQEGRAAHGVRVQPLLELVQAVPHQQRRNLGFQALHEHALELLAQEGPHALNRLEHHVAGEAVG